MVQAQASGDLAGASPQHYVAVFCAYFLPFCPAYIYLSVNLGSQHMYMPAMMSSLFTSTVAGAAPTRIVTPAVRPLPVSRPLTTAPASVPALSRGSSSGGRWCARTW